MSLVNAFSDLVTAVPNSPGPGSVFFDVRPLIKDLESQGLISSEILRSLYADVVPHRPQIIVCQEDCKPFGSKLAELLRIPLVTVDKSKRFSWNVNEILKTVPRDPDQLQNVSGQPLVPLRTVLYDHIVATGTAAFTFNNELLPGIGARIDHVVCLIEGNRGGRANIQDNGMSLSCLVKWDFRNQFLPGIIAEQPIERFMKAIGWEIVPAFDTVYRSGPTEGVFRFKSLNDLEFAATAGQTPHFICVIGMDNRKVHHAWYNPETKKFCFHESPAIGQDLDDTMEVRLMNRANGFDYAREIAQNPQRTPFNTIRPKTGRTLEGGF